MNAEQYRTEYLVSPHWLATRAAALERAGNRCQVCNSAVRLEVHHRTYENLGRELPADLTVLCRACHGLFHGVEVDMRDAHGVLTPAQNKQLMAEIYRNVKAISPGATFTTQELAKVIGIRAGYVGIRLKKVVARKKLIRKTIGKDRWLRI